MDSYVFEKNFCLEIINKRIFLYFAMCFLGISNASHFLCHNLNEEHLQTICLPRLQSFKVMKYKSSKSTSYPTIYINFSVD